MSDVLMTIGDINITDADVEAFIQTLPEDQRGYASNAGFRQQCVDRIVEMHLFHKMAVEEKIDETDEFKDLYEKAKIDILAQLAMKSVISGIEVSEAEAKEYYEENKVHFMKEESVSAKHILVDNEDTCKEILDSITSGAKTFEDAAKESSTCPSGAQGGDLGVFGRGQMVKEFEDAAFNAQVDDIVGPVQTQFGYHLIKVEKKNEATAVPFEEVEGRIKDGLLQFKQRNAYTMKAAELREKYVK